ncbi:hypothetical protein PNP59_15300, partial [Halobacterium salinarum]|uniref:hypothetical protein n=1 Tax=Halobacterium salinarum TaxID=2242 RepID=UPI0025563553
PPSLRSPSAPDTSTPQKCLPQRGPRQATLSRLGPSRTRSGSRRRRTVDVLRAAVSPAVLLAVRSLSDVARDAPRHNSLLVLVLSPSPLRSSLKLPASSSLMLSSIADAVPNRTFETLGRIAARVSATKPRPPAVAVAVVVAVPVPVVAEAAAAAPLADAVAVGPRPVLSPSPSLSRSPSLPHSRDTPSAR